MTTGPQLIHLAIATDAGYLPWTATAIRSVLDRHDPTTVAFHVLHDGSVSAEAVDELRRFVGDAGSTVDVRAVSDPRIDALTPARGGGRVTWFRLLFPELFPQLERLLLIDADTFVVDGLAELWSTDLGDDLLGAVPNVVEPALHAHVRSLGLPDPRRYLNAGVLLFDLEGMRNANVTGSLVRFATDHPGLFWLDQDTLNVVLEGRWLELDPRWNAMNSLWTWTDWANDVFGETRVDAAKRNPAILHFEGPSICKPWHVLSTHAFKDAYRDALGRTPWPDTPLIGRSILTTLIGLLPERNRLPAYIKVRGSRGI